MDMSASMAHFIGNSYPELQYLRAQAERLGFWDDVAFFDAVLREKLRRDPQPSEREPGDG